MDQNSVESVFRREFARCRKMSDRDNSRVMDAWVVENRPELRRGDYLSFVKGRKSHFIVLQNGSINTAPSGRFRTGIWFGGEGHISSFNMHVSGKSCAAAFRKQVRTPAYTYREYEGFERIDFAPFDKNAIALALLFREPGTAVIEMTVNHMMMWPENRMESEYVLSCPSPGRYGVKSPLSETSIAVGGAKSDASLDGNMLRVTIRGRAFCLISIGMRGSSVDVADFARNMDYHSSILRDCVLVTPSFEMNKYFLWARHDILELFSESSQGNGFFAGMPEFSWFFGRDGEWISMAAIECGLHELAGAQLDMLSRNSEGGRIPHEIPLTGHNENQHYGLSGDVLPTRFMSADSTPLWIMATLRLEKWHRVEEQEEMLKRAVDFCISCDRDGDVLIENRFKEGLIGWPESWASYRDGACIDVNAWWLKALEEYAEKHPEYEKLARKGMDNYISTFFRLDGENLAVLDSVDGKIQRKIGSPMEIVPAMYWKSDLMRSLVGSLSGTDMITPWGVRSMASSDPMYDRGYHTGEVWPLMTGWFAIAAFRNGFADLGFRLLESFPMLAFSSPEPGRVGETYHPEYILSMGQFAQGWSSSLFVQAVMEGLFGINPDGGEGAAGLTHFMNAHLPDGWSSMKLRRVSYRGRLYDISVTRKGLNVIDSEHGTVDETANRKSKSRAHRR